MTIRFYLETFGCSLNSADSDIIVGTLSDIDGIRVDSNSMVDLIIMNTCGVKEPTEDRIISRLEKLSAGITPVIIAGCLPKISLDRIKQAIPSYSAIIGPQSIDSLRELVPRILKGERGIIHLESTDRSKLQWLEGPPESVICTIPICEGCLGNCAYCAVRFARGAVKSYPADEIYHTIERCVHTGYKEIRITSQDLGVYGVDINSNLVDLLRMLDGIKGNHRFRLGMFNPNLVSDYIHELVEIMKSDHFFKFFHIPLQSGSDRILNTMERKYTVKEWELIVGIIRESFDNPTIATDIIVGFPGETEHDFQLTMDTISRVQPSVVNISKYGDRPGTIASKDPNKVETSAKKARSRRLSKLVNQLIEDINKSWIGWEGPVIVTEAGSRGGLVCRTPTYRPLIIDESRELGDIISVRVINAERTHLIGTIVS